MNLNHSSVSLSWQPPFSYPWNFGIASLAFLPYNDQRRMLRLSRAFHAVALRYTFSSIRIYMEARAHHLYAEMFSCDLDELERQSALELRLLYRSWQLLQRISYDPTFAALVKEMAVVMQD